MADRPHHEQRCAPMRAAHRRTVQSALREPTLPAPAPAPAASRGRACSLAATCRCVRDWSSRGSRSCRSGGGSAGSRSGRRSRRSRCAAPPGRACRTACRGPPCSRCTRGSRASSRCPGSTPRWPSCGGRATAATSSRPATSRCSRSVATRTPRRAASGRSGWRRSCTASLDGERQSDGEAAAPLGVNSNAFRYGAATGTIAIRWDGARAPLVWTVPRPGHGAGRRAARARPALPARLRTDQR